MDFQKKVSKNNYVRECVVVLNGLLGLTPREIDILSSLIKLDSLWVPRTPIEVKNVLSTDSRRLIMKESNMNKSNFTKIVNKLTSIGLLVKSQDGKYVINELLKPTITRIKDKDSDTFKNIVEIKFILEVADAIQ